MFLPDGLLPHLLEVVSDGPEVGEGVPAGLGGARARDAVALAHLLHLLLHRLK